MSPRRSWNECFMADDKMARALALLMIVLCAVAIGPYAHGLTNIATETPNASHMTGDPVMSVQGELIIGAGGKSRETLQRFLESWNAKIVDELPEINAYLVRLAEPTISAMQYEAASAVFEYAEPNYYVHAALTPNDPLWASQWGLSKVGADLAWDIELGSRSMIVAVVDTGIDYTHGDLAANYLQLGYDWVNGDDDPMDDSVTSHGTRVAGIIGAATNNGLGVAGLAQVSIMAEKVLDSSGAGTVYNAAQAVIHAVGKGARITNNSYGNYVYSDTLKAAFEFARNQGVLNVAAAGNDNTDQPFYPAAFGGSVISVAGTDQNDAKYASSNHGDWIELSAPAVDIVSTVRGNLYGSFDGTSMSSAFVTGAAALMMSHCEATGADEIRRRFQETAVDLGATGKDPFFGYGRIDISSAIQTPCHTIRSPPVGGTIVEPDHSHVWRSIAAEVTVATMVLLGIILLASSLLRYKRKALAGRPRELPHSDRTDN